MISRIDLRGDALPEGPALRDLLPRADFDVQAALEKVRPICEAVHHRGDAALIDFAEKFDGVRLETVRVPAQALTDALAGLDPAVRAALEESIRRARLVHREQRRTTHTTQVVPGGSVTEKWVPVERVGLYAPGGRSVYPSSVVMNVVPAQEAGVESIALASPAQAEFGGLPHPTILAACALLGVDEVYAAGGATAVAMFAYGTESCPPATMVTGPGNIWVAAAKRYFTGKIGIDAEAGPTEIAILADAGADPVHVASDLISQAEHDPLAAAVLVTDSVELADAVEKELEPQVAATKHIEDRIVPALKGKQSAIVLVDGIDEGLRVKQALGDKVGIYRFGNCTVPLDESLAQVTVDLSGRPYLVHTEPENMAPMIGEYDTTMTRHILESFVAQAQIALHVHVPYGRNAHHIVECQFKALARALRYASERDPRAAGILPSTKGAL
ncbi:Histidinol dehydrogenase [Streptomyces canarius]